MIFDRARVIEAGWNQGVAFNITSAPSLYAAIEDNHKDPDGVYLILSHPCSLLHYDLMVEQNIEYILGKRINEEAANNLFGKNPRLFDVTCTSTKISYRFSQNVRGFISRQNLNDASVCPFTLTETNKSDIKRWMSNRYLASALPDMFDKRMDSARSRLKKIYSKEIGKLCRSVYLIIDEPLKDLNTNTQYNISIFYTLSNLDYQSLIQEEDDENSRFDTFIEKVKLLFDEISGVHLENADFISESNLTLEQLSNPKFIKWNLDLISLGKAESQLAEPIQ